jgi:hypothetical protein
VAPGLVCRAPSRFELVLGFVACFFDTLGIGSFAPRRRGWHLLLLGRATIEALEMNRPLIIAIREEERARGRHPAP